MTDRRVSHTVHVESQASSCRMFFFFFFSWCGSPWSVDRKSDIDRSNAEKATPYCKFERFQVSISSSGHKVWIGTTHTQRLLANDGGSTGHAEFTPITHSGSLFDKKAFTRNGS